MDEIPTRAHRTRHEFRGLRAEKSRHTTCFDVDGMRYELSVVAFGLLLVATGCSAAPDDGDDVDTAEGRATATESASCAKQSGARPYKYESNVEGQCCRGGWYYGKVCYDPKSGFAPEQAIACTVQSTTVAHYTFDGSSNDGTSGHCEANITFKCLSGGRLVETDRCAPEGVTGCVRPLTQEERQAKAAELTKKTGKKVKPEDVKPDPVPTCAQ